MYRLKNIEHFICLEISMHSYLALNSCLCEFGNEIGLKSTENAFWKEKMTCPSLVTHMLLAETQSDFVYSQKVRWNGQRFSKKPENHSASFGFIRSNSLGTVHQSTSVGTMTKCYIRSQSSTIKLENTYTWEGKYSKRWVSRTLLKNENFSLKRLHPFLNLEPYWFNNTLCLEKYR